MITSGGIVPPCRKAPFVTQFWRTVNTAILDLTCMRDSFLHKDIPCIPLLSSVFVISLVHVLLVLAFLLVLLEAEKYETVGGRKEAVVRWKPFVWLWVCCFWRSLSPVCVVSFLSASLPSYPSVSIRRPCLIFVRRTYLDNFLQWYWQWQKKKKILGFLLDGCEGKLECLCAVFSGVVLISYGCVGQDVIHPLAQYPENTVFFPMLDILLAFLIM